MQWFCTFDFKVLQLHPIQYRCRADSVPRYHIRNPTTKKCNWNHEIETEIVENVGLGAAYYEQGNFNLTVKWREWSWLINDIYLLSFGVASFVNRELDSQIDWAFYCNDEWLRERNNRFETVIMQLLNSFDPYSLCVMASNCSNYSINQYNVGIAFYQPVADYRSHICPFS